MKNIRKFLIAAASFFLIYGCVLPDISVGANGSQSAHSEKRCGDGVCDGPENNATCPDDCSDGVEGVPGLVIGQGEPHWVTNPASGEELYMEILMPAGWEGDSLPALVLIPGGSGDSSDFTTQPQKIHRYLENGYALIVFDPDGRGRSDGAEDDNGFTHQDGLAAVVRYVAD